MNAIAAAVIGGTSLFGGRGRTWNALLGVLVIVSIQYGLALEGIATPIQYMITGGGAARRRSSSTRSPARPRRPRVARNRQRPRTPVPHDPVPGTNGGAGHSHVTDANARIPWVRPIA